MSLADITGREYRDITGAPGIPELVARCVSIMVYHYNVERSDGADAELEDEARGIALLLRRQGIGSDVVVESLLESVLQELIARYGPRSGSHLCSLFAARLAEAVDDRC